jgi:hypothetical protein
MRISTWESVIARKPDPARASFQRARDRFGIGNRLIMDAAVIGVAQKEDREEGIDEQDIFDRVVLFLAALTFRLFRRVLGADDTPFRPVMDKGGRRRSSATGDHG